jgi:hypothetical protein
MKNKRNIQLLSAAAVLSLLAWHCGPSQQKTVAKQTSIPALMTHKEAVDTLRADTTQPVKPVQYRSLDADDMRVLAMKQDLGAMFIMDYPDNGFYGDDRYRIEFVFTEFTRDAKDPFLYHVKGKNRFKKTISYFSGTARIGQIRTFMDPNLDTSEVSGLGFEQMYTTAGSFELYEDSTLSTSGAFRGTFAADFGITPEGPQLWFFTDGTEAKGTGFMFDGYWTSYKNAQNSKPVLWARDIFRIANNILKDFAYGERDVEINSQYRHLGWDNFWEAEEWWHEGAKKEM